ncbi:MAG TPA: SDR family NAD(P)-dependent oxidoreductase [Alphaproteobacteria bacterium]|nr:SDR family NAD(P)-dependent oxidoreductase [Alphaproteobacteria bacterium]
MAESSLGRLAGRIALITGASRGIGAAVALRYAGEGARLILAARTVGGLEEVDDAIRQAGGERATLVPVDLRQAEQIDRLGAAIFERFGRLDVLVGNAGALGTLSPIGHVSPKDWDEVIATNLTANFRLIRAFDPLLRRSAAGRAIFVTSGLGRQPIAYWGPYAVSKAALEMLVGVYAAEIKKTSVRVNLIDPGIVRTAMRAKAFPGENPDTLRAPQSVTERFVELAETACALNGERVQV